MESLLTGSPQDFPVVESNRVVGILMRQDLLAGLTCRGQQTTVGESMQREFETIEAAEMLETAQLRHSVRD